MGIGTYILLVSLCDFRVVMIFLDFFFFLVQNGCDINVTCLKTSLKVMFGGWRDGLIVKNTYYAMRTKLQISAQRGSLI